MITRGVLVLALLVLPVVAQAQRRGGGTRGGSKRADYSKMGGGGSISISNKDVESLSPAKVLLDKKKDLALTDDQLKQLKAIEAALKTQNDTLFKQIDSLRKEMRVNSNAMNPQVEELRVRGARTAMVEVIKAVRDNYDAKEADALAILAEPQQKAGSELLDKHQAEAEEMLQEKLGGKKRS